MSESTKLNKYYVPLVEDLPKIDRPFFYRVAIVPLEPIKVTAGGIIIPDAAIEAAAWVQHLGVVVCMGESAFKNKAGKDICEIPPKPGDVVMYGKFAGLKYTVETESDPDAHGLTTVTEQKVIIIQDTDVISVIKDPTGIRTDK